jgi:hypothetical protein
MPSRLAEIARSGYPETAVEDAQRAAEAVRLFISDTIACLDRTGNGVGDARGLRQSRSRRSQRRGKGISLPQLAAR